MSWRVISNYGENWKKSPHIYKQSKMSFSAKYFYFFKKKMDFVKIHQLLGFCLILLKTSIRGIIMILPHVVHSSFISTPILLTFQSCPPHGCGFLNVITSSKLNCCILFPLMDNNLWKWYFNSIFV